MNTKQKIIISVIMLGTLMGSPDSMIVILAFPTLSESLHAAFITMLWVFLIYLLVVAFCTTNIVGGVSDAFIRRLMPLSGSQSSLSVLTGAFMDAGP
jgi:MFS family permease